MVSSHRKIVSSPRTHETEQKIERFQLSTSSIGPVRWFIGRRKSHSNAKAVEFDEPNLASDDSRDGAQLLLHCASPFNLNRGDRSWAMAISILENKARIAIGLDRRFKAPAGWTALP